MPMYTWAEQARGHLTDVTAIVLQQHPYRKRYHLVFARSTRSFFAPITRQRVHGPRSDPLVLVVQILDEFG
ncbi:MAG TPA: hypothetical protein VLA19_07305 [Herpetosiphonaceae bacterium]|nr:hypothetical protein [Herpetosiphonaceae bacterium]